MAHFCFLGSQSQLPAAASPSPRPRGQRLPRAGASRPAAPAALALGAGKLARNDIDVYRCMYRPPVSS